MSLKPPQQSRSRRTLDRLVEAALTLMADQGVERTSVSEIVRKAKSSVGSFYARFEGKEDFVIYLEERVWSNATDRWDAAVTKIETRNATTPELVAGIVRLLVETRRADASQRRVLGQASGSPDRARRFHNHVRWGVTRLLSQRRSEFTHPAPERAIPLGYGVIARAVDGLDTLREGLQRDDDEELVTELTRLYLAYLGSPEAPPRARPARAPVSTTAAVDGRPDASGPEEDAENAIATVAEVGPVDAPAPPPTVDVVEPSEELEDAARVYEPQESLRLPEAEPDELDRVHEPDSQGSAPDHEAQPDEPASADEAEPDPLVHSAVAEPSPDADAPSDDESEEADGPEAVDFFDVWG